jgi:gallate dioxygenase
LEKDPEALTELTHAQYAEKGGVEGAEIIMWLIMRGALSDNVTRVHRDYCLPSLTAIGTVIFENKSDASDEELQAHRQHVAHQLAGVENIDGIYPFTLEVSHRAYRLNDLLHRLVDPEHRRRFVDDSNELYNEFELTDEERQMLDDRDWISLIRYGVIFFCLEKMAAVLGISSPDIYAQMRGETLNEFLNSRNIVMQYSVAGGDEAQELADKTNKS